jgi:hypothetical protein
MTAGRAFVRFYLAKPFKKGAFRNRKEIRWAAIELVQQALQDTPIDRRPGIVD